jgi:hypothetical protein
MKRDLVEMFGVLMVMIGLPSAGMALGVVLTGGLLRLAGLFLTEPIADLGISMALWLGAAGGLLTGLVCLQVLAERTKR